MKKIIALALVIVMMLGLCACAIPDLGGPGTGSGAQTGSGTQTGGAQTGGSQGGNQTDNKPQTPTHFAKDDTLVYVATTNEDGTFNYLNERLNQPTFTPYYHNYKAALSMTFDDGGHYQTGYNITNIFQKYGFRGTEMITASFVNDKAIEEWNKIVDLGYMDIGCHGYDHANPPSLSSSQYEHEIKDAIMFLREKFPTQDVLTYASPLAQPSTPYEEYVAQFCIANRLEGQGEQAYVGKDFNMYRIRAVSVNTRSEAPNQKAISTYVSSGAWLVELYHEVREDASGINCTISSLSSHCKMLYDNFKDELWVASFEDVAKYVKQRENTFVEYLGCTMDSITFKAGCTLDTEVYDIPMSLSVNVPSFTDSAYIIVDGEKQHLEVTTGEYNKKYVTVLDIDPQGGEFTIYLGGNSNCQNGCNHIYYIKEKIAPTCTSIGYNINACARCDKTYEGRYTAKLPHVYMGNPIETQCPTTEEEGYRIFKCRSCDHTKTEIVPVLEEETTE